MDTPIRRKESIVLNNREFQERKKILDSTPQYVTIGAHYGCNARCLFCLGGDYPPFSLDVYRNFFEPKLGNVLSRARFVGFCGWGEVLLMPGIGEFLDHINRTLPGVGKVFTTNGIALTEKISDKLLEGTYFDRSDVDPYSILVSLHASNPQLHAYLTGTKAFERITRQIRYLTEQRKTRDARAHVRLIFIMTVINIGDLPSFVALAEQLGADEISCNYLSVFEPEQLKYSCFFQREKTNEMLARAEEMTRAMNVKISLPPLFGKHEKGKDMCQDPWNFFYVETQGSVNPCCFAGDHIGYLNKDSFETIWNGEGYSSLRTGLVTGNIHQWCKYCYRFDPNNVNDIRSHITFRPETQPKILDYLRAHKDEFPIPEDQLTL
jgi:MoaA/NifB/PqqE/SkfB family radical SAM enzyme